MSEWMIASNGTMKVKKMIPIKILFFMAVSLIFGAMVSNAQPKPSKTRNEVCYRWLTQVDPSFNRVAIDLKSLSDEETIQGIECLLQLRGKTRKARFSGATRANLESSQQYSPPKKPATVEIAALYYASYLYYENWEHAGSISLYDADLEKSNTKKIVKRAFESYRKWFRKVIEIGLRKARTEKLDPLDGSGLDWS